MYKQHDNRAVRGRHKTYCGVLVAAVLFLGLAGFGLKLAYNQVTAAPAKSYQAMRQGYAGHNSAPAHYRANLVAVVKHHHKALAEMYGRDIRLIFGNPQQVRRDRNVHVWQYRSAQCVIDIYLRELAGDNAARSFNLKSVHYDVRKRRMIKVNAGNDRERDVAASGEINHAQCIQANIRPRSPDTGGQNYASLE